MYIYLTHLCFYIYIINSHTDDFKRDWWWPIGRNIVVCLMYTPITDNTTYDYYKRVSECTDGPYNLVRIFLPSSL